MSLVDFVLHFDKHLLEFIRDYGSWVYAILFTIVFAETGFVVTPFLPGDSLLFAAGALCARGDLSITAMLVLRGTKTLALRMQLHNANGLALAEFVSAHPKVKRVYYPGLPTHPQHELAKTQMNGFGGMLAFDLGSLEAARRLLNAVRLHALAESLGGVETLISHPATMTHASVPAERRAAIGITDGLVRISAGLEDIDDLKEDLSQAFDQV